MDVKKSMLVFACVFLGLNLFYHRYKINPVIINRQTLRVLNPNISNQYDVVVVGAGLSGAVMAYLHANLLNKKVLVIEKRDHIAGNCYDYTNNVGIRVSQYGAHLFHTKHESVWKFVHQFGSWTPYEHR